MQEYIETPFNYTGSKFKLLPQLLKEFDYNKNNFIDLFSGGGSVWTNVSNLYKNIYINDIIYELIFIQESIINDHVNIINKMKNEFYIDKNDKEKYLKFRDQYNENRNPYIFYALLLSCTNNMIRFNKSLNFNQTFGRRSFNKRTEEKIKKWVSFLKKSQSNYFFYSENFYTFVNKINYYDSMIYIDPPYGYIWDNGEMSTKQISEAGYNNFWSNEDELNLYKLIIEFDKNNVSFVLSGLYEHNNNKSWLLNKLIGDGFKYKELKYDYNKVSRNKIDKKSKEMIIKNF